MIPWAGSTTTPNLRGVNLVRTYGDGTARRAALRDVSVDLFPGQIVLLMGPSGSGKSTLLAILSGLLEPDTGQVLADDDGTLRDVWAMTDQEREAYRRRHTGFIFQGYNLFPALTARQQLEIVLKWGEGADSADARRRADEMLDRLGLEKNKNKKPAQLSGGEKQRVAIGRALVKNPSFMFADEPTSALDWENGQKVIELLRDAAHQRGASVLCVSHDHRILPFVDVYYHLEDGHLERRPLPTD
ncbi:ABC transporter ATP-binding protein [Frigoriglobus tundricola]|uniref:ABC transporter, ATP-binding protein n=1 Tax=Frigoriglobus tundricola TaxID=2774151 RepID=A0A6M5YL87_9BACT|nr:ABC transporter ATP-binding protein [Frigoriglobus tundricola]QJW94344.1 ABC transporter, ATP-binding protein [Frigoriglobus tundricola]